MLDIREIEKNPDLYKTNLKNRNADASVIDQLLAKNDVRKKCITEMEVAKAEQNKLSQEIPRAKREGKDTTELMAKLKELSDKVAKLDTDAVEAQKDFEKILQVLPNKCHESVPVGKSEEDNKIIHTIGNKSTFSFKAKEHWELGEKLGIIDFERAAKISGARFAVLRGAGALMERALIQFMLDLHTREHGYEEMIPPFMVNSNSLFGTGQFPKFVDDVFHLQNTDYHLIPTAEVPVTNYFAGEVLSEEMLPVAFASYTPCFRSEAGSYGRDVKGLIRQHQFNKVEIVRFAHPDTSYEQHELLTSHAEEVLKRLELPFQRMALSTGDIGFGAAKCYDLNVWLPGQNAYREISSCSNFEDFQARRANIRFKALGGKPRFVHTLNGSGLAVGRTLVAILENFQHEDGSIAIPKVLHKYTGGLTEIK